MESVNVERDYFVLINSGVENERTSAYERLKSTNDPDIIKLADFGQQIHKVIIGKSPPSILSKVFEELGNYPVGRFWSGIMEATGQTILEKAFTMPKGDNNRPEIIWQGLKFIGSVLSGGMPISDFSLKQVKKANEEDDKKVREFAQMLINEDSFMKPERGIRFPSPPKKSNRRITRRKKAKEG